MRRIVIELPDIGSGFLEVIVRKIKKLLLSLGMSGFWDINVRIEE